MVTFVRPATSDEKQYAHDIISGKRPLDVAVCAVFAVIGALIGLAVGISSAQASEQPVDIGFTLTCVAIIAVAFLVFALLIMGSIRSLQAVCRVWVPARVIVALAAVALALRALDTVQFVLIVGPSAIASQLALDGLGLIFALLFLNLGVRLVFIIYCMATGRDEDEIITRSISADGETDAHEH